MALTESLDHVARAKALLVQQFKTQPNITGLLASFIDQTQKVEAGLFEVLNETHLDNAVGQALDVLGAIVGQARQGRDDATYRIRIRARIKLNLSSGTREEILAIMVLILGGAYTYVLKDFYPSGLSLEVFGSLPAATATEAARILSEARAAGVGGDFVYAVSADTGTFAFASGDMATADAARGFGADDGSTGGHFADAIDA